SKNGLQVKGKTVVGRVAVTCDAALETIQKAAGAKADLLIVHHGLFWKSSDPRTARITKNRVHAAQKAGLSIYAMHLPLDAHPVLGNNAVLARKIGMKNVRPCVKEEGGFIALKGDLRISRTALAKKVKDVLGEARVFPFGPSTVRRVAVCTGGGAFAAMDAKKERFDALITGEVKHSNFHDAKESFCNLIEAGHYNTEILGVRAVGEWLEEKFGLPYVFIDAPTGL
ncbi:MAG TPA: Nif3-like dinuclear metal center hexameric protein, partial [Candidatus Norongarragalinales archaeon]|nr:Nif3-like dinuclear metal center hexameric protein [Candidatus Norongarragalinales archaeon]